METLYGDLYHYVLMNYSKLCKKGKILIKDRKGNRILNPDIITSEFRRKLRVLHEIVYGNQTNFNVFAEKGYKLVGGDNTSAISANHSKNAERYLRKGWVYTVQTTIAFDDYTLVELEEFPGVIFESAAFSKHGDEVKDIQELLKEYGPELEET